jgi:hypothetical protein
LHRVRSAVLQAERPGAGQLALVAKRIESSVPCETERSSAAMFETAAAMQLTMMLSAKDSQAYFA